MIKGKTNAIEFFKIIIILKIIVTSFLEEKGVTKIEIQNSASLQGGLIFPYILYSNLDKNSGLWKFCLKYSYVYPISTSRI